MPLSAAPRYLDRIRTVPKLKTVLVTLETHNMEARRNMLVILI